MSIRENLEIEPFTYYRERPTGFIESIRDRPRFVYDEYDLLHRDVEWLVDACEVVLNNCRLLVNDFGWQNQTPDLTFRIEQIIYYELHRLGVSDDVGVKLVFDGPKLSINTWPKDTSLNEEIKEEIERRKNRRACGVGTARTVSRNVTMLISGSHCNEVFADWLEDQGLPDQAKACRGATWSSSFGQDQFGVFAEWMTQTFRLIHPGTFMMGSPENEVGRWPDEPLHEVTIPHFYWMADSPVTQGLWLEVMGNNPSLHKGDPNLPVESITREDLLQFLDKVPLVTLPSEEEWEYACRAGTTTATYAGDFQPRPPSPYDRQFWGPELEDIAWFCGNSMDDLVYLESDFRWVDSGIWKEWHEELQRDVVISSKPVKLKTPNSWGLYDILGNVFEVVRGPNEVLFVRGGGWASPYYYCRAAHRHEAFFEPKSYPDVGFRLSIPCS